MVYSFGLYECKRVETALDKCMWGWGKGTPGNSQLKLMKFAVMVITFLLMLYLKTRA